MGELVHHESSEYQGRAYQAKDNIVIEKRIGADKVSLSAPIDFVESILSKYIDMNISVKVTVEISIV